MKVRSVALVAEREIREQLRGKALWVSTIVFVVAIVAVIVIPAELKGGQPSYRVALAEPAPSGASAAIQATGEAVGAHVKVTTVPTAAEARAALTAKGPARVDFAVVGGSSPAVVVDLELPAGSVSTKALLASAIGRQMSIVQAIDSSGLPPAQAAALVAPRPLPVEHLRPMPGRKAGQRGAALAGAILFFILIQRYGFGLLTGVIQEKSGRVIELLLPAVSPVELLAGKVAGSGLVVLVQTAVFAGAAVISGSAVGSAVLRNSGAGFIAVSFLWIVIGFFFYATLYAAAGSLASRPEDAQSVALPLQLPLFLGYFVAFTALGSGSASGLVKVLAYLPPTAPLDMPVLQASGGAGAINVIVAMVVCVCGIVVVARLAGTIFARSILHSGSRLRARQVLRAAPGSSLTVSPGDRVHER